MTKPEKPAPTAEVKSVSVEFKAEPEGVISAYAAVFDTMDSYGDVIKRGAFAKTIAERKDKIKVLVNHDGWSRLPIGKPLTMSEDSYGLLTVTKMSKTQQGQDIYTLAQEGAINELSIGYYALKALYTEEGSAERSQGIWRYLNEVKLIEYSFLSVPPANEGAVITGIKSAEHLEHEIRRWTAIAEVNLSSKAGRVLSGANAKRIRTALKELQDLLVEAGIEEAADDEKSAGTSDPTSTKGAEPPAHSPLLSALQHKAHELERQGRKTSLLSDLRRFGQTLGGTP